MEKEFFDLIKQVTQKGIRVTLMMYKGQLVADLNFEAKSHGYLTIGQETLELHGRYDYVTTVGCIDDLLREFLRAYRMRDFGSQDWMDLCVEAGLVKVKKTTTTSYEL